MTIEELLEVGARRPGLDRREARILLSHATGRRQEWLVAHGLDAADPDMVEAFLALVDRRAAGEPVAYLTGTREFYGRPFAVTPAVLIPRAETELLVEVALDLLRDVRAPRVLDMGTGSGVLAVTLVLERPDADVVATDVSAGALQVACTNAGALGAGRVRFRIGDWWQALDRQPLDGDAPDREAADRRPPDSNAAEADAFDLIVSNPPYIAADDPHLQQGDLRFEPRHALSAGPAGDADLRRLIENAPSHLTPGGWIALEHGLEQGAHCRHLMQTRGFADVATRRDLEHRERVTFGRHAGG
jgi:release factor glutamine methyltransferase